MLLSASSVPPVSSLFYLLSDFFSFLSSFLYSSNVPLACLPPLPSLFHSFLSLVTWFIFFLSFLFLSLSLPACLLVIPSLLPFSISYKCYALPASVTLSVLCLPVPVCLFFSYFFLSSLPSILAVHHLFITHLILSFLFSCFLCSQFLSFLLPLLPPCLPSMVYFLVLLLSLPPLIVNSFLPPPPNLSPLFPVSIPFLFTSSQLLSLPSSLPLLSSSSLPPFLKSSKAMMRRVSSFSFLLSLSFSPSQITAPSLKLNLEYNLLSMRGSFSSALKGKKRWCRGWHGENGRSYCFL